MGGCLTRMLGRQGAAAAWTTVRTSFVSDYDSTGWNGWTGRQRVFASSLTDATASQIRISFKASPTSQLQVAKAYVQLKGAAEWQFASTPVQIMFGGSAGFTVASGVVKVSDTISFSYDGTSDLIISTYHDGTAGYATAQSVLRGSLGQKSGDDAATLNPAGFGTGSSADFVWLVEALI